MKTYLEHLDALLALSDASSRQQYVDAHIAAPSDALAAASLRKKACPPM